jgi:hypothetical protein
MTPFSRFRKIKQQANVKSEDPGFLCKDTSSAIHVKIAKINGVS